jgi:hypothetical protein
MRRLVGWIGGLLGGITAYRLLRRRPQVAPATAAAEPDDRADELRAKLAESRETEPAAAEASVEPVESVETAEEQDEPETPEDRRRRVHEEGRAALDDMTSE